MPHTFFQFYIIIRKAQGARSATYGARHQNLLKIYKFLYYKKRACPTKLLRTLSAKYYLTSVFCLLGTS